MRSRVRPCEIGGVRNVWRRIDPSIAVHEGETRRVDQAFQSEVEAFLDESLTEALRQAGRQTVIIPFSNGRIAGRHAASIVARVIPPMAMFGRCLS